MALFTLWNTVAMNTSTDPRLSAKMRRSPVLFVALGFGTGCLPKAPGTWGTMIAIPLCWLAQLTLSTVQFAALALFMFLIGIWLCEQASLALGRHDHPAIVWDEITGYFITMIAAPKSGLWLLLGFALFRLFDIFKPWPIRQADRMLEGGFGVMADDILAAAYAWVCLQSCIVGYGLWG